MVEKKEITIFYSNSIKLYKGKYYCDGAFGRYFIKLTKNYKKVFLCAPTVELDNQPNDFELVKDNWELQSLPSYSTYAESVKYFPLVFARLLKYSKKWTKLYIRFPSPYSLLCAVIAKLRGINFVLHVVGDSKVIVNKGTKYKGLTRVLANTYCSYHDFTIKILIKFSEGSLFNGFGMRRLYSDTNRKIKEIRTSTFDKDEIYCRNDNDITNILFVGYLRHEKGVSILLNAFNQLGEHYKLTIVGDGPEKQHLEEMVNNNSYIKDRVKFKGHIPLGSDLFDQYKDANIFILPSISEGTPRVIVEAMAFGNIVIASDTGGIPFTVTDKINGLLFEVGSSTDLTDKIKMLESDKELRKSLRDQGYNLAKSSTLDSHVNEVFTFIEERINYVR
jgi:glycosyltransferase involved in cell wall biosynthesis